jgi:allantoin racemase
MRILVVNPNTTASMTAKIGAAARAVAAAGTEITAIEPEHGPVSVEGHYDGAFCLPGLLQCIRRGEAEGYDGFVVACFDDPGIGACREIATGPVVGICEASMIAASLIATGFSVVTTLPRAIPVIEELAHRYGMERRLRKVRAAAVWSAACARCAPRRSRSWSWRKARRRPPRSMPRSCARSRRIAPRPSFWAAPAWPIWRHR